ncbi:DUF4129 domain-containing transglutaminase family protein [Caldalkalibacillus salinus]|uniref:DUF4129 domain-containing transglutaminase family protein n=1 Tax=Caldalkalibacillus salinus TaxID=2803787 RepID=UPI0019229F1B|nr:transglutaminase domain-containing protein [Caldalkalibacillus salinus]
MSQPSQRQANQSLANQSLDKQPQDEKQPLLPVVTMAIIGILILLVWEWFRPMMVLTETYTIQPFILFFAFAILQIWLNLPIWMKGALNVVLILYFVHSLYFFGPLLDSEWLTFMLAELVHSLQQVIQLNFADHSWLVKTLFFFVFLWTAASYLYTLLFEKGKVLLFVVLTVTFLGVIDAFSPYESNMPMMRTLFLGFGLLALNHIRQTFRASSIENSAFKQQDTSQLKRIAFIWLVASLGSVLVLTSIAYLLPKAEPSWPDPVSFLEGYSEYARGGTVQRIGYGSNDEQLGGPFIMDEGLVFTAETQEVGYWRGESKNVYTGKGWIQEGPEEWPLYAEHSESSTIFSDLPFRLFEDQSSPYEEINIRLQFEPDATYPNVFYQGQPERIYTPGVAQMEGTTSGKLQAKDEAGQPQSLDRYMIDSAYPSFSITALQNTRFSDTPEHIKDMYTQLPDTLPERVYELAQERASRADTDYEIVKQIERFLRYGEFEYNVEQTAIPGDDQDYVDQFLFETKKGYCDNFSTAMVVMLRTLDIPARWVKGFTFGEVVENIDGEIVTEVRNKNAHSWVEVFFPGVGWVPFEPTRSFYNLTSFDYDYDGHADGIDEQDVTPDIPEQDLTDEENAPEQEEETGATDKTDTTLTLTPVWGLILFGTFVLLVTVTMYIFRKRLLLAWALAKYKRANPEKALYIIYEWLVRLLGRFVSKREPSETVREYISRLEQAAHQEEWRTFTQIFEELRYNKKEQMTAKHNDQALRVWKTIMKKLNL